MQVSGGFESLPLRNKPQVRAGIAEPGGRAVMACSVVAGLYRVSTVTHSMTVSPWGGRVQDGEDQRRQ
jgi:hypothetical protein